MKIVTFIILIANLQVSAKGYGQEKISLTLMNAPLKKVFAEIEKKTSYSFVYLDEALQNTKNVDVHVTNASIEQVLNACFKDQPLTYAIVDKLVILKQKATNPPSSVINRNVSFIDVKGKVTNEKGEPLSGASISLKGKSDLTITDAKGEFSLTVTDNDAVLIVTYIGYVTQEIKLNNRNEITVQLNLEIGELDIVSVSTGYQEIPKERATGSFAKVDNKLLNQQVGTNILKRLDGVTSSLIFNIGKANNNPQNNTKISIRGLSTINGPLDPLIVLDNFIYEGDINNINPNDIESITVLKDAAAASIWGARAGNGVIVIATKKGRFSQRLKIDLSSIVIIESKPDLSYISEMPIADYIDVEQLLYSNGAFNSQLTNSERPALPPAVEVFLKRSNGIISAQDSAALINALKSINGKDQYNKFLYKNAVTQQYALNARGGTENLAWLISGSYDKNVSSLDAKYDKVNFRISNTYKPIEKLLLNLGIYYTNSRQVTGASGYNSMSIGGRSIPYLSIADNSRNPLPVSLYREGYLDTAGAGKLLDWKYYPLVDYKHDKTTTNVADIIGNFSLSYELIKGLKFNANYQLESQRSTSERLSDLQSYNARNFINLFTQIDAGSGTVNNIIPKGAILGSSDSRIFSQNLRGQLNFNQSWKSHSIYAIAGAEVREVTSKGNSYSYYGYNEDPLSYGNVDFFGYYPTYISGSIQGIPGQPSLSPTITNRFVSLFTNISYLYKQRYILSLSARKDGANIFGLTTNDKWTPLWSAGLGWELSKERFYKFSNIPYLKIKATYGYSGNVDLRKSPLPIAIYSTNPTTNFPYARITTLNNPSLKWEQVGQLNISLEFSTKNQIISGSLEYFKKNSFDLYGGTPYDYTTWGRLDQITKNVANLQGNGVDITLQSRNIDGIFKWTSSFLFSYIVNKTTKYNIASAQNVYSLLTSGNTIVPVIGKPLYAIVAYKWGGLDNMGNPQGFLNGQKSIDYNAIASTSNTKGMESGSIIYIGPTNPSYFGSIINEFTWKQLSATINISYRFKYYFRKQSINYGALISSGIGHSDFEKRWMKPGDEAVTNVPSFIYPNNITGRDNFYGLSDINVEKGDHIRIQYVNVSYMLNKRSKKQPFEQLQLFANASNLGIIWRANKVGLDPDYPSSIPPSKSYAVGIRATF